MFKFFVFECCLEAWLYLHRFRSQEKPIVCLIDYVGSHLIDKKNKILGRQRTILGLFVHKTS